MNKNGTAEALRILQEPYSQGTTVTNCVVHMSWEITERPDDCTLCLSDLRNFASRAARVNADLNDRIEKACAALKP